MFNVHTPYIHRQENNNIENEQKMWRKKTQQNDEYRMKNIMPTKLRWVGYVYVKYRERIIFIYIYYIHDTHIEFVHK